MRRQATLFLLALLAALAAGGPATAANPTRRPAISGQAEYDIRDFGGAAGADLALALQQANNQAVSLGIAANIRIPSDAHGYQSNSPVWFGPNVTVSGEGDSSQVYLQAPWIFGVPQGLPSASGGGAFPESSFLVDYSAWGDGSYQGLGYNLGAGGLAHRISLPASPFELGPPPASGTTVNAYAGVPALTVNFWFRLNAGTWPTCCLAGLAQASGDQACPWMLWISGNLLQFDFTTSEGYLRSIRTTFNPATTELKGAFEFDCATGQAGAFLAGQQAACDLSRLNTGWGGGASFTLNENRNAEFTIGGGCDSQVYPSTTWPNMTVAGLSVANELTWALNGTGTPQVRASGGAAATDAYRFAYGANPKTFAALAPGVRGLGRSVPYRAASGGWGTAITSTWGPGDTVANNAVRDLRLASGGAADLLRTGANYRLRVDRVTFSGGARGMSSLKGPTSYVTRIKDCVFANQSDTPIWAYFTQLRMSDCELDYPGRDGLRTELGTHWLRDTFLAATPGTSCAVRAVRNQRLSIRGLEPDWEPGQPLGRAIVWAGADPSLNTCPVSIAEAEGCTMAAGRPYVELSADGASPQDRPQASQVDARSNFGSYYQAAASYRVDGPYWGGAVQVADGSDLAGVPLCVSTVGGNARIAYNSAPAPAPLAAPVGYAGPAGDPDLLARFLASGIVAADGATVASWADAANSAKPATAAGTPAYSAAGFNGHPCVKLTSTAQSLAFGPLAMPKDEYTVVLAIAPRTGGGSGLVTAPWLHLGGTVAYLPGYTDGVPLPALAGKPAVLAVRVSAPGPDRWIEGWLNLTRCGHLSTTSAAAFNGGGGGTFAIGGGSTFDLAELILFNRCLSDADLNNLQRWLSSVYGIPM